LPEFKDALLLISGDVPGWLFSIICLKYRDSLAVAVLDCEERPDWVVIYSNSLDFCVGSYLEGFEHLLPKN